MLDRLTKAGVAALERGSQALEFLAAAVEQAIVALDYAADALATAARDLDVETNIETAVIEFVRNADGTINLVGPRGIPEGDIPPGGTIDPRPVDASRGTTLGEYLRSVGRIGDDPLASEAYEPFWSETPRRSWTK